MLLSSNAGFQVPSLRNGFSMWHGLSSREAESERKENTSPTLFSQRRSFGALTAPSFASSRAIHALASRSTPLGLGLGLPSRPLPHSSPAPSSARTYGSQGELIGAAYLLTTDIMFWSGLIGAVVFRRNLIVMLLCTEIVMLAANMNFLFASAYLNDMTGVIMSITITTIAACETAIGLALCVTYFHIRSATDVEALNLLK